MNSSASSAASKRCSATTSSALRMTARSSLGAVSMAWVYMPYSLFLALVDDATRLADKSSFDRIGRPDAHRGAHAGQRLDAFLQVAADGARIAAYMRGQQFAQHFDLVQQPVARDDKLVLAAERAVRQHDLLDLRREQVHAADDQHVVGAADNLAHAAHAARGGRQQAREVARAVADHREGLLGERGEDELALLAVGQHLAGLGVDDLGIEMVFPDDRAVLRLHAFAG